MKIRSQLAWLVVAVVAPVALLAAASTLALFETQRAAHAQRYLERVRGLQLALDTELRGIERLIQVFTERDAVTAAEPPSRSQVDDAMQRLMRQHALWAGVAVVEPDGSVTARLQRDGVALAVALDEPTRARVLASRQPAVSDLVAGSDGRSHFTFVAAPALAGGRKDGPVVRIVAIAIDQRTWLGLLQGYPIAPDATLTLNDSRGVIVARTLNNERWVGTPAPADYWARVTGGPREGSFLTRGLEGQTFYSAYSKLEAAPWSLGTGVPASTVEAALRQQTALIAGGVLLAGLLASAGAWWIGRRVTGALKRLADTAADAARVDAGPPLAVDEAEAARRQLRATLQAQQQLRDDAEQARAQAEAANRGKDEFVAVLAHELRNPLSAMGTAVALLEAAGGATPMQQRAQDALRRQVQQMSRLVDDLLDAARVRSGKLALQLEDVDLASVVPSVLQAFADAGRTQHLQVELLLEPAVVRGDPMRLEQVVANLIDNAAKFTGPRGRVEVQLQCVAGHAVLTVRDDGAGIPPAMLPHLFHPYTQAPVDGDRDVIGGPGETPTAPVVTPPRRAGLGLGLHVVERLVALQGGSIEAHSAGSGQGACFTVRLPLAASGSVPPPMR